jgi:hypothetical protein
MVAGRVSDRRRCYNVPVGPLMRSYPGGQRCGVLRTKVTSKT